MKKIILGVFVVILAVVGYFFMHRSSVSLTEENSLVLKDSLGEEVRVPKQPQRLIFMNTSNLEIYLAVGGDKAIGRAESSNYPADLKEAFEKVPSVGAIYAPNLEKIMGMKPDLVIGTNVPFNVALRKPFQVAGVPLYINVINSYEDVLRSVDLFGALAGKEKEAAAKRQKIEADYAALTKGMQPKSGAKTLVLFGSTDSFSMATSKSFTGDLLARLGAVNIADGADVKADSAYIPLSLEYVTKQDPEVLMLITMGDPKAVEEHLNKEIAGNAAWKDVQAVKNGRVHVLPANLFTVNPGTHIIDAMKLLQGYLTEAGK